MGRRKTWGDEEERARFAAAAEAEAVLGLLDPLDLTDPADESLLTEFRRIDPFPHDPAGAHMIGFYRHVSWDARAQDVGYGEDCPWCGSVVVRDPATGEPTGHVPGPVQERPAGPPPGGSYVWPAWPGIPHALPGPAFVPGPPRRMAATEDTCAHCHRSGLDARIIAAADRQEARLEYLRSAREAGRRVLAGRNLGQRLHGIDETGVERE